MPGNLLSSILPDLELDPHLLEQDDLALELDDLVLELHLLIPEVDGLVLRCCLRGHEQNLQDLNLLRLGQWCPRLHLLSPIHLEGRGDL